MLTYTDTKIHRYIDIHTHTDRQIDTQINRCTEIHRKHRYTNALTCTYTRIHTLSPTYSAGG